MSDRAKETATPATEAEGVAQLMGEAAAPDLEASALAAAEEAIAKAEQALASADVAAAPDAPPPEVQPPVGSRSRERILQGVLLLNVVLLGVMMALPNPPSAGGGQEAAGTGAGAAVQPAEGAGQEPGATQPIGSATGPGAANAERAGVSSEAWIRALQFSGSGDYERAAQTLEAYLQEHPNLPTFERKTYYTALMHYLAEAGREADVELYQGKLMALGNQRYLPADILRMARDAEDDGDGSRMRQLYARFLLTQKKHTAAERKAVAEAYLKLGDSYRVQAERGEERAAVMQRMREARLHAETRERRNTERRKEGKQ